MNPAEELNQVEISIEQAKAAIDLTKDLVKLSKNPEFDRIIHKGYFESEAVRLVMAKADPNLNTPEIQADIIKAIDAIGSLRQYLTNIMRVGNQMELTIAADEQTREAILAEELEK